MLVVWVVEVVEVELAVDGRTLVDVEVDELDVDELLLDAVDVDELEVEVEVVDDGGWVVALLDVEVVDVDVVDDGGWVVALLDVELLEVGGRVVVLLELEVLDVGGRVVALLDVELLEVGGRVVALLELELLDVGGRVVALLDVELDELDETLEVDAWVVVDVRLLDVLLDDVAVVETVERGGALELVLEELVAVLDEVEEMLVVDVRIVVVGPVVPVSPGAGCSPGSRSTMTSTLRGRTRTRAPRESAMSSTMRAISGVNCPVRTRSTGLAPGIMRGTVDVSVVPGRSITMRADWSRVPGRARVTGSTVSDSVTTTDAGGP